MKIRTLIPRWQLVRRIRDLAYRHVRASYGCDLPLFLVVMDGGRPFADELLSHLPIVDVVRVKCSSYTGTEQVNLTIEDLRDTDKAKIYGRDVVILDDIYDTGRTLRALAEQLQAWGASDVRAMTLLSRRSAHADPLMLATGFNVPTKSFLVGFGLDYNGQFRDLDDICTLEK